MNTDNAVIPDGAVLISPEGRIQAVGEASAIMAVHPGVEVKRLKDRLPSLDQLQPPINY